MSPISVHPLGVSCSTSLTEEYFADRSSRHLPHRNGAATMLSSAASTSCLSTGLLAEHDIVAQEHRERLVAHESSSRATPRGPGPSSPSGARSNTSAMSATARIASAASSLLPSWLSGGSSRSGRVVEVVLDGGLAPVGDYEYLLNARGHRLLDDVLNDRLINQREAFPSGILLVFGKQPAYQDRRRGLSAFLTFIYVSFRFLPMV